MGMTLDACRQIAIKELSVSDVPIRFRLIGKGKDGKEKWLKCEWIDPENGVFKIMGIPGFIDMRMPSATTTQYKYCEIIYEA